MTDKQKIVDHINQITDDQLLQHILEFVGTIIDSHEDRTQLTPSQVKQLDEAIKQSENGRTFSSGEVREKVHSYMAGETKKLKENFHRLIDKIEDDDLLYTHYESLSKFFDLHLSKKDVTDELSHEQIKRLEHAIEQSKTENTIPHSEMKKRIREWITK
jgi:hypothetical protein